MAEQSAISWTDATFNPWIGCTKVSPACDHCYAERDNGFRGWVPGWGPGVPRRRTSPANWKQPLKWNKQAAAAGKPLRVFCASLADVFDNEVPQEWRNDLFILMEATPHLRWLVLTKRIGNVAKMIPWKSWAHPDWDRAWPRNVGLMATIANQEEWDRDYSKLAVWQGVAPWIGVSAEPLLGRIDIGNARPDWIITGGESGPKHRALDINAVRFMRDQCGTNGITFHHKQNGGVRGKDAGCLVDGVEHKHFPAALAA